MKILKEKFLREEELQGTQTDEIASEEEGTSNVDTLLNSDSNNILDTNGMKTTETDVDVPEVTKTVWKVSFTLGSHENWSRFESETEEEAENAVAHYITKKWPDRDFKITGIEKYVEEDELEEQLNESLNEDSNATTNYLSIEIPELCKELNTKLNKMTRGAITTIDKKCVQFIKDMNMVLDYINESLNESQINDAQPIETGAAVGMATVISDLIKAEYESIDGYNSAIATAEAEGFGDMVNVLTEIQAEENLHIGQLQAIMNTLDPNAHLVDDGQQEGIEQLANPLRGDKVAEESLKEDLDSMSRQDQEMFIRCVNEIWNMSVIEWVQKYYAGQLEFTTVNSYEDIPDTSNLIEISSSDLSQGTGNVIVYTYMNAGDGTLYRYAEY